MRKGWMSLLAVAAALSAQAEPLRPFMTRENRQPELFQLEAGVMMDYHQATTTAGTDEFLSVGPQFRYGLAPELTLDLEIPYVTRTPDVGDDVSGIGDVKVGLTLRAWEDIFGFPYLIPYAQAAFPTDNTKGLGETDPWFTVGLAVGTTVYDRLHYALDVSLKILSNEENVGQYRGALIYDLSKKTSILVEGELADQRVNETDQRKVVMAGLTYKPTRNWIVGFYGGGLINGTEDTIAAMKVSYSFRPFIF